MSNPTETYVRHLNPDGLSKNRAFSQVIVVSGSTKTVYVGGQDAMDGSGNIVGKGDIKKQAEQVLQNLQIALSAADAKIEHIVKWNVYIVQGQSLQAGFEAFQKAWGMRPNPPTIAVLFVAALANPDFLIEMDAIAVVPDR
ncbi:aminoacrylate peracid reductase [Anaerolineae bacterium]|nr:aminoacrylate peracid reductase [Anaerolineae bacterium]